MGNTYNNACRRQVGRAATVTGMAGALILFGVASAQAITMPTTGRTTQPIGHYEFCQRLPGECQRTGQARVHQLTRDEWAHMVKINNHVNTTVTPLTDMEIWGQPEVWSFPTDVGDCEDYVLLKRQLLIEKGFHPSNLLITVVRQPNGEGHAVLTVRTDRGDFILDNLVGEISDWRDTPYTYLKRQSLQHAGLWEGIDDSRMQVSSSR